VDMVVPPVGAATRSRFPYPRATSSTRWIWRLPWATWVRPRSGHRWLLQAMGTTAALRLTEPWNYKCVFHF